MVNKEKVARIGRKALSVLMAVVLMAGMIPLIAAPSQAVDAPQTEIPYINLPAQLKYEYLRDWLLLIKNAADDAADDQGSLPMFKGYSLDLGGELTALSGSISTDLGVAAALAGLDADGFDMAGGPVFNDARFAPVQNSNTSTGYTQTNFNTLISKSGGRYEAAVRYLEQGGITEGLRGGLLQGYAVQWLFSFKSKLNPAYSTSLPGVSTSITENGKLPSGTTLAHTAKNVYDNALVNISAITNEAVRLLAEIDNLKAYIPLCDITALQEGLLELACPEGCDADDLDCDWTHRLVKITADEYITAAAQFKAGIERDIDILYQLVSGDINRYWEANTNNNGNSYYNNTAAHSVLDKFNAAFYYLENGGYTCGIPGGGLYASPSTWLWYKSSFTSYTAAHAGGLTSGSFSESNKTPVLSIVGVYLTALQSGTTADNLDVIYNLYIDELNNAIAAVGALSDIVPGGGLYNQTQYEAAKAAFIASAERDLAIAGALLSGDIDDVQALASVWVSFGTTPQEFYTNGFNYLLGTTAGPGNTIEKRYANAISFFNNGGYADGFSLDLTLIGLGRIGMQIEFKSGFHPDYSSGLFGIAANKSSSLVILRNTLKALEKGNPYLSPVQEAKLRYETKLAEIHGIINDPAALVESLLSGGDEEITQLMKDLNLLVSSLDDILLILDMVDQLGIGASILDPILSGTGITYEMLQGLSKLKDILNGIGIDTSSGIPVEEQLANFINDSDAFSGILSGLLNLTLIPAQLAAAAGTEAAYNSAFNLLDTLSKQLTETGASALNTLLQPVMTIIEPIRPYLGMLTSGISLVRNGIDLFTQASNMISDFSLPTFVGDISGTTRALGYLLDDLADFLEYLNAANLTNLFSGLLDSNLLGGIGDMITGGLAGVLNTLVNGALNNTFGVGDLLNLDGSELGFLGDLANSLISGFLDNPTALVPLLRSSADILVRVSNIGDDIQLVIGGDWGVLLTLLVREGGDLLNGTTIGEFGALISSVIGLFSGNNTTPETVEMAAFLAETFEEEPELFEATFAMFSEAMDINATGGAMDPVTVALCSGMFDLSRKCLNDMKIPGCNKAAIINCFVVDLKAYIKGFRNCMNELCEIMLCIKDIQIQAAKCALNATDKLCKMIDCYKDQALQCLKDIKLAKMQLLCSALKDMIKEITDCLKSHCKGCFDCCKCEKCDYPGCTLCAANCGCHCCRCIRCKGHDTEPEGCKCDTCEHCGGCIAAVCCCGGADCKPCDCCKCVPCDSCGNCTNQECCEHAEEGCCGCCNCENCKPCDCETPPPPECQCDKCKHCNGCMDEDCNCGGADCKPCDCCTCVPCEFCGKCTTPGCCEYAGEECCNCTPCITYTVVFIDWDGTTLKTVTGLHEGDEVKAPSDPVREGYVFDRWDVDFSNIRGDLTVQALYQEITITPDLPVLDPTPVVTVTEPDPVINDFVEEEPPLAEPEPEPEVEDFGEEEPPLASITFNEQIPLAQMPPTAINESSTILLSLGFLSFLTLAGISMAAVLKARKKADE